MATINPDKKIYALYFDKDGMGPTVALHAGIGKWLSEHPRT